MSDSVLPLLRRRLAAPVFLSSLLGFGLSLVYASSINPRPENNTPSRMAIQAVILTACLLFAWDAQEQSNAGVLR